MPRQFDVILNCIITKSESISPKSTIFNLLLFILQRMKKGDPPSSEPPNF